MGSGCVPPSAVRFGMTTERKRFPIFVIPDVRAALGAVDPEPTLRRAFALSRQGPLGHTAGMLTIACNAGLAFEVEPAATALIAIDLQRDFLDPAGYVAAAGDDVSAMRAIIPNAVALLATARAAGLTVIHTREGYAPDLSDMHALKRERNSAGTPGPLGRFLIRGEAGHGHIAECLPLDGEVVVDKPGFGSFYRTDLETILHDRGIERLILLGVTTQCCVASTMREAVDRGFRCLTVEDAYAAVTPELHAAAISLIYGEGNLFGWVSDTRRVLAGLASP